MTPGRIVIAGASGFIGSALARELVLDGHEVVALTRNASERRGRFAKGVRPVEWDGRSAAAWGRSVEGALAVVNLAGDNLARGRWTRAKKDRILESRTRAGSALVEAVREARTKPRVFVQASAIGFYGNSGEAEVDEEVPAGKGFLAGVVKQWEASTREVESMVGDPAVSSSAQGSSWAAGAASGQASFGPSDLFGGRTARQRPAVVLLDRPRRRGPGGPLPRSGTKSSRERSIFGAGAAPGEGPCRVLGEAMRRPCGMPVPAFFPRFPVRRKGPAKRSS